MVIPKKNRIETLRSKSWAGSQDPRPAIGEIYEKIINVRKKVFIGSSIVISVIVVVIATYFLLLPSCNQSKTQGIIDRPPISSIGSFFVITDQGPLLPGQTYHYQNEGPWVGDHTLLIVISGRAVFITHYPVNRPTYKRVACRAVYP